jgi:hypothetical protein
MEGYGCIYYIHCKETNKGYVGQHNKPSPEQRYKKHWNTKANYLLHNAMRKYGKDAFTIDTLCTVPINALPNMEAYWAEQFETYMWDNPGGYNMVWCGDKPRTGISYLHSEDTRKRMSQAKKGKQRAPFSDEHRKKMSKSKKNISEETRKKMIDAKTGKKLSEETCKKMSEISKKRQYSEETRKKMSDARKLSWAIRKASSTNQQPQPQLQIQPSN